MPTLNSDVAEIFREIADLLEIQEANEFRVRSYRDAARTVASLSRSVVEMAREGEDLTELEGIGDSIAEKIEELAETGGLDQLERLREETPTGLRDLMHIEGLGPKRVAALYEELGVTTLEELGQAARDGEIQQLEGFGEKTQQNILEGIERAAGAEGRTRLDVAEERAESLAGYLGGLEAVDRVEVAGSYRRRKETVGDLDILVSCEESDSVMEAFVDYEDVERVEQQGETKSTVFLRSGMQVDLRVVEAASYGAALHYFTGSKAHNIAVRRRGIERGLKINEYGVFRVDDEEAEEASADVAEADEAEADEAEADEAEADEAEADEAEADEAEAMEGERIAGETEEEVYAQVDMVWVAPELREDQGEVELAAEAAAGDAEMPDLIERADLRGDLQMHTPDSDGRHDIEEMAEAARELGHEYIGITDHSQAMAVASGMDAEQLRAQMERIDALNDELDEFRVLKGCEVDILPDGSLDMPDEVLAELDFTVCSVHSKFNLDRDTQTERILRAMDHPGFSILGHPTGRRIGQREGYALDMEAIVEGAAQRGVVLEINAQPERLDLRDRHARMAREAGVRLVISTDAHTREQLSLIRFGVDQARRGWVQTEEVVNTHPADELLELLDRS